MKAHAKAGWIALVTIVIFSAAFLAIAASRQIAPTAPSPLPGFMPRGALLYLEAKDFPGLLAGWSASPEKQQWLTSDDYEVFSRSRLFLRLGEAQKEFAAAAGIPPDMSFVTQAAGGQSALALYDIGNLEFLYISRVSSTGAMQSALWQARPKFESRSVAGSTFYVHTDALSGRTVAFAVTNDYLLLATREDLIASSLQLMAGGAGPRLTGEDWYTQSVAAAGAPGDLRMILNMEKITPSPYFRSYWAQPNAKELRGYSAAISDVHLDSSQYREDRVLLPKPADSASAASASSAAAQPADAVAASIASSTGGAQAVADLVRLVPGDAAVYRASADPTTDASLDLLRTKILSPSTSDAPASKNAPAVNLTGGEVGGAGDLETRIDQPPSARRVPTDPSSVLRAVLASANVQAILSFDSAGPASGTASNIPSEVPFVEIHSAVVLRAAGNWDPAVIRAALARAVEQSTTTQGLGTAWKESGDASAVALTGPAGQYFELDGLLPIRVAVRGNLLMVANNPDDIAAVLAQVASRTTAAPASFVSGVRLAAAQPGFLRLTSALDRGNPGSSDDSAGSDGEPPFFSANLGSLGRVFSGVDSESVEVHTLPGKTLETVTYNWKP
jgi:hypothetical protein